MTPASGSMTRAMCVLGLRLRFPYRPALIWLFDMPPKGKEVPDGLQRLVGVVVNAWAVARASRALPLRGTTKPIGWAKTQHEVPMDFSA